MIIATAALATAALFMPSAAAETAIAQAVAHCEATEAEWNFDDEQEDRQEFYILDEGHSVYVSDFADFSDAPPAASCLFEALSLPQWFFYSDFDWDDSGTLVVDEYTVMWRLSESAGFHSQFLLYDSEVGGGQR